MDSLEFDDIVGVVCIAVSFLPLVYGLISL